MRKSFIFYSSYYEAISELPANEQGAVYKAIIDYGIAKKEPNLKGIANAMFKLIKPTIDAALNRYDANVENGKKGGRPSKTQTESETQPNDNPTISQEKPNDNPQETQSITQVKANNKANKNLDIDEDIDMNKDIDMDFKLVNKNKNIFEDYESSHACARVSEKTDQQRLPYLHHFKDYFDWCFSENFKNIGLEIIDTIIEAKEQSKTEKGLLFNSKRYTEKDFIQEIIKVDNDKFRSIVSQLAFKQEIQNRPLYILGCVLMAASDPRAKVTKEQFERFVANGG